MSWGGGDIIKVHTIISTNPALLLNLVDITPALPLPACLLKPCGLLNRGILMTTPSALNVSVLNAKSACCSFLHILLGDDTDNANNVCIAL